MEHDDEKGMLFYPNLLDQGVARSPRLLVVTRCFCPNGHDLVSRRASFNNHPGILLRVRGRKGEGQVALSPVYGEKCRVALDVELEDGDILELLCPVCGTALPAYAPCPCGARLITLFLSPRADYSNCIGICNRVGCVNAEVKREGELIVLSMLGADALPESDGGSE
ncbi:MAG TPA: hypothetical protein PKN61_06625 [Acidobacteriota bacterium]|jgi:hypothetical protein|nr:hypothetical protein [Acidobacteriota bacterium]HNU00551.1 hypothetical protein [Acidobacteriota bacterium]HPB27597.1 hypothetical protein [Acidobacteriota bacterium]HQO24286.1 hypothetical protein [Acidobacteriota bacterium]HQP73320.1 hypothetical protein [Acidobacteriota bacterium]